MKTNNKNLIFQGLFFLAILFELIQVARAYFELQWSTNLPQGYVPIKSPAGVINVDALAQGGAPPLFVPQPFRLKVEVQRSVLHVVELAIGYSLMLVVMTFNVGFVLAILGGAFIGHLVLGRYTSYVAKPNCC